MMRKLMGLTVILLVSAFCSSGKKDENLSSRSVVHRINPQNPANPDLKASFSQVRLIEEEWLDFGSIFYDRGGNIIYWQERENLITKFDPLGNLVLKKKFTSGQGSGDINLVDFEEDGGRYYIWDKWQGRLNVLDKEFNLIEAKKYGLSDLAGRYVLRFDSRGNLHFIFETMRPSESGSAQEIGIAAYGKGGKDKKVIYYQSRFVMLERTPGKRTRSHFLQQPLLRYLVDENDAVWVCDRREYKISKYRSDGSLEKVIEKTWDKIPVQGALESRFREAYRFEQMANQGTDSIMPEFLNPVLDFSLIDGRYLLVLRMDYMAREDKKGWILADLFNLEGEFLTELEVPEFYQCYSYGNQFKSAFCNINDRFAMLQTDEEWTKFRIGLYDLKIESAREQ